MLYLVDGEAWQTLDHFDPEFARTALLFVLVYQWMVSKCTIPSNKCLKEGFILLALVIPGSKHLKKKINMPLRPLLEELKGLC
jgi:hypothetical protein